MATARMKDKLKKKGQQAVATAAEQKKRRETAQKTSSVQNVKTGVKNQAQAVNKNRKSTDTKANAKKPAQAKQPQQKQPAKKGTVASVKKNAAFQGVKLAEKPEAGKRLDEKTETYKKANEAMRLNRRAQNIKDYNKHTELAYGEKNPWPSFMSKPKEEDNGIDLTDRTLRGKTPMNVLDTDIWTRLWTGKTFPEISTEFADTAPEKEKTKAEVWKDLNSEFKNASREHEKKKQTTSRFENKYLEQWYRDAIKYAKADYELAKKRGDTKGMEAAHDRAEEIRRQYGSFSGGEAGDEYITPKLAQEDIANLNKKGEEKLAAAKIGYANATTDEERKMYAAMGEAIRNNPEYQPRNYKGAYRNETGEGRMMYGGTEEERKKEGEQLAAIPQTIAYDLAGSFLSLPGTTSRALHSDAARNQDFLQNLSDIRGGGEVNIYEPEKPEGLTKGQELLQKAQEYREKATEGQTGLEKYLTEALITTGEMAPGILAGALSGGATLPTLATLGLQAAGGTMGNLEAQGVDSVEAFNRGVQSGLIEALTELIPVSNIMKMGKGGKSAARGILAQLVEEPVTEDLSEVLQYLSDTYYDSDKTKEGYIKALKEGLPELKQNIKDTTAISILSALGMGTGAAVVGAGAGRRQMARQLRLADRAIPALDIIQEQMRQTQEQIAAWKMTDARLREQLANNVEDPTMHKHILNELEQHEAEKGQLESKLIGLTQQLASRFRLDQEIADFKRKSLPAEEQAVLDRQDREEEARRMQTELDHARLDQAIRKDEQQRNPLLEAANPQAETQEQAQPEEQAPVEEQPAKREAGIDWNDDYVRKMSTKAAKEIDIVAKALGVPVRFEDLNADKDQSKPWTFENGYYDKNTGEVVISRDIVDPIKAIIGHEFTHRMQALAPEEYKALKDYVMSLDAYKDKEQRWIDDYAEAGKDLDIEEARDEIVADFAGTLIQDENLLRDFALNNAHNVSLLQKVKDFFTGILNKLTGKQKVQVQKAIRLLEQTMQAATEAEGPPVFENIEFRDPDFNTTPYQAYRRTAGEVEARDVTARRTYSPEQRETLPPDTGGEDVYFTEGNGYFPSHSAESANGETRRHSIRSSARGAGFEAVKNEETGMIEFWRNGNKIEHVTPKMLEDEGAIGMMIKMARDHTKTISKKQAKKQLQGWADLLNLILKTQESELVWEFAGAELFSAVKANSDKQYKTTIDFGTICVKTQDMIDAMSDAMYQLGRGLNKDEITALQKKLKLNQATVPCPVCYVFSRWAGVGGLLDNMKKWHYKYLDMTDAEVQNAVRQLERAQTEGAKESARNDKEYGEQYREMEAVAKDPNASEEDKKRAKREMKAIEKIMKRRALGEGDEEFFQHMSEAEDLQNKIDKISEDLRELKRTKKSQRENSMEIQLKEKTKAKFKERLKEHNDAMKEIEKSGGPELSWLKRVRTKPDYFERGVFRGEDGNLLDGRDFDKIIFDLNATKRWVEEAPLLWEYRKSRGAGLGKAILPYSDFRFGDLIQGDKNNSASGSTTWEKVGKNLTKTQEKNYKAARNRLLAQKWMGGQRFQSTSDFRYDYALDYLQAFLELQALGGSMQTYTKVLEFADMVTKIHGDANMSVMPLGRGYDENGKLMYSDLTGINAGEAIKLRNNSDSAQLILVGINDEHIRLAMQDSEGTGGIYVDFIIPYHPSGASIDQFIAQLVQNLDEEYNPGNYQNYEVVQNDIERDDITPEQSRRAELRRKLLTRTEKVGKKAKPWSPSEEDMDLINRRSKNIRGRDFKELFDIETRALNGDPKAIREYESWSAGVLNNIYQAFWADENSEYHGVNLTNDQADMLMPNEYWDTKTTRDTAYINGFIFRSLCYSLGLHPRFTGWSSNGKVDHGNFRDQEGYWKTLIDRRMYDRSGKYRKQEAVNITDISGQDQFDMLTPAYGQEHYGNVRTQQPDNEKALRASDEFVRDTREREKEQSGQAVSRQYSMRGRNDGVYSIKQTGNESVASYTDERIDTVLKEYGGGGNYAQGFVTYIDPNDFLKLTLNDSTRAKWEGGLDKGEFPEEFFPLDEEKLRGNRQTPYLRVHTATGEVEGHEGRHRMLALARAGITKAPVVLVDTATKYSKEPTAQMRLTSQDFGYGPVNGGYTVMVENLLPTNKQYRDQIKEAYGDENADVRFSIRGSGSYEQMHESIYGKKPEGTRTTRHSVGAAPSGFDPYTHAANEYGTIEPGENPARMVDVPRQMNDRTRVRRWARTAQEAAVTPDEAIEGFEEGVTSGLFNYTPRKDKQSLRAARRTLAEKGYEGAMEQWSDVVEGRRSSTKDDIVLAQCLYVMAARMKDFGTMRQLAAEIAAEGTIAGQKVQALRLLKKATPEGKLYYVHKIMDKIQQDLEKKRGDNSPEITIDPALEEELLDAQTEEEQDEALDKIYDNVAEQIPPTFADRMAAWRYFAMLGNPRTHIRNILGNTLVQIPLRASNKISALAQTALPQEKRTRALASSRESMRFARGDYKEVARILSNGGKYMTEQDEIERRRKLFPGFLQKAMDLNSDLLEREDAFFKKGTYIRSLASFITARGWNPDTMTEAQLEEARSHAINDALVATFQNSSELAKALAKAENFNAATKIAVGGNIPFKSVPINIAKMGWNLSPVGLLANIARDSVRLRRGDIDASDMIDHIAMGLTGTGVAALGYFLAAQGILTAGGGDDDKENEFEVAQGNQNYALNIGDHSYTIDWAAPAAIPLFFGAELHNFWSKEYGDDDQKFKEGLEAASRLFDPMMEMTFMSGISGTITSAAYNKTNPIFPVINSTAQSYAGQFVPTLLGQIARTMDDTRRTTYVDRDSPIPNSWQRFFQKQANKIPGLSKSGQPYQNVWGDYEQEDNVLLRAFENLVSPGYIAERTTTDVDRELSRLSKLGFEGMLPTKAGTDTKINDKYLTGEEYETLVKTQGSTARDILAEVVDSPEYQALTDEEKAAYVKRIFDFSKQSGKLEVGMPEDKADSFVLNARKGKEEVGLDPAKFLASYVRKLAMDKDETEEDKTAKAIDFEMSIDEREDLTPEQKQFIRDNVKFWRTIPVDTGVYTKARDAGMTDDEIRTYLKVKSTMDADNNNSLSDDERIVAIKNSGQPYETQEKMWNASKRADDKKTWADALAKADEAERKQKEKAAAYQKYFGNMDQEHIDSVIYYIRNEGGGVDVSHTQFHDTMVAAGVPKSEWPAWYNWYNANRGHPWGSSYEAVAKKKGW